MKNNKRVVDRRLSMNHEDTKARAYLLVSLRPGSEKKFSEEILSKGLLVDSKVERMDFVHGPFDFILTLRGEMDEIDRRIMEMRKSPHVRKTATLLAFEMFEWESIKRALDDKR